MSKKKQNIVIGIIFVIGLFVFLYPIVGNVLNDWRNKNEIAKYERVIQNEEPSIYAEMFEKAREINQLLPGVPVVYEQNEAFYEDYKNALSIASGMMGYLIIDKINVHLSILHGTTEDVLQNSVGYLEGTHLPTGDIGNSTVLTGHTGLPSAELLTNLDQLEMGDTFEVAVLNEVFTYEVFEINVVLPYEVDAINPREGIDMVTLVTCTPYGINSHRLLVHGKRIFLETTESTSESDTEEVVSQVQGAHKVEQGRDVTTEVPLVCIPVILLFMIQIVTRLCKSKRREEDDW